MKIQGWRLKIEGGAKVEATLWALLDKMACAYGTTRLEVLRALREADEIVYANGIFRLITPTKPDGRIAG